MWLRGTMMSRVCASATLSTPSSIVSSSGASTPRSTNPARNSTICSRSLMSPRPWTSLAHQPDTPVSLGFVSSDIERILTRIRVRKPKRGQQLALARFHRRGLGAGFVIVTLKVQHAVHDHVRPVRRGRFTLLVRLALHHGGADDEVAERQQLRAGGAGHPIRGER